MCLAIPVKIKRRLDAETGLVDYLGNEMRVNLSFLPGVKVGDFVIVHAGFAISRLDAREARKTLRLLREMAGDA
ncbi:MAG: HypC/HybG/HupF family hydrogenase formation chaperone [Candidatus Aminicenantes bacterium]|nr:HypC/HybG/HupF family hydrogenase formation chaperone [Candidatus Aminicenantes bacterium]